MQRQLTKNTEIVNSSDINKFYTLTQLFGNIRKGIGNFIVGLKKATDSNPQEVKIEEHVDEYYMQAVEDLEREKRERYERAVKLLKLRKYYIHFNIRKRYGIKLKLFVEKVDKGLWQEWVN